MRILLVFSLTNNKPCQTFWPIVGQNSLLQQIKPTFWINPHQSVATFAFDFASKLKQCWGQFASINILILSSEETGPRGSSSDRTTRTSDSRKIRSLCWTGIVHFSFPGFLCFIHQASHPRLSEVKKLQNEAAADCILFTFTPSAGFKRESTKTVRQRWSSTVCLEMMRTVGFCNRFLSYKKPG